MAKSFQAQVGDWVRRVNNGLDIVFREAAQRLALEMDLQLEEMVYKAPPAPSGYKRTGFLRASFMASTSAMPTLNRENPGGIHTADLGDVTLVINGADIEDVIYLGYTANYAAFVHYGSKNNSPPKPWVTLVAQRWPQIIDETARDVRKRLGL